MNRGLHRVTREEVTVYDRARSLRVGRRQAAVLLVAVQSLVLVGAAAPAPVAASEAPAPAAASGYPIFERVSLRQNGSEPSSGVTRGRSVSTTGRYIALMMDGLVYVRDLQTNVIELMSYGPTGTAFGALHPSISGDGCKVSMTTAANLTGEGVFDTSQVYVRDRCASPSTVVRVSVTSEGVTYNAHARGFAISGDGEHVLFGSRRDLSGGGANSQCYSFHVGCLFVHDLDTGKTARMDVATNGTAANFDLESFTHPDISNDGRRVIFASEATNLVAGDTNGEPDAFVHDRDTDADGVMDEPGSISTIRISVAPGNVQVSDHVLIRHTAISGDGRHAGFSSFSKTIIGGNTNPNGADVFVRDLGGGGIVRFGRDDSETDELPEGWTTSCCGNALENISDDGARITFTGSRLFNPEPGVGSGTSDVFVYAGGVVTRVTDAGYAREKASQAAGISGDGRVVVINSLAALLPTDTNGASDVYAAGTLVDPAPAASIGPLKPIQRAASFRVTWSAAEAGVDERFDVQYRRSKPNGTFPTTWTSWRTGSSATSSTIDASSGLGKTYCFRVRISGGGPWSPPACTAVPLDDRALTRTGTWTLGTAAASAGYYRNTYLRTTTRNAAVSKSIVGRRLWLVATTGPNYGTVKVYLGDELIARRSLSSATVVKRKTLLVATFASPRSGTLRVVVTTNGKRVEIDGLGVSVR